MNKPNEPITLPSGLCGTYEELKARFQNNEITERADLKALRKEANARFETYTAGVISSFAYYDVEEQRFYEADLDTLENTFVRVCTEYLREAAVIKGDDVLIKIIDEKMQRVDDNMLERCEFERTLLRCPHLAEISCW